jgi:short-subunit dehydrogenase
MQKIMFALLAGLAWLWKRNQDQQNAISVQNKVVIITGAAQGIGRATANAFAQAGAHLLLVDKDQIGLVTVQDELAIYPIKVNIFTTDITSDTAPSEIVAFALSTFGRIDVLVNNAGMVISGDTLAHTHETMQRLFEINVLAVIRLCQAVLPTMHSQHSGHIVNLASSAATMPSPGYSVYGASKGAVVAFSHALRREVAQAGIRVSYIAPGWINTQMIAHMHTEDMTRAGMLNPLLSFDVREPSDVANGILEAVRYNRYEVIVGGMGFHYSAWLQRLSPRLLDVIYTRFSDTQHILSTAHRPK